METSPLRLTDLEDKVRPLLVDMDALLERMSGVSTDLQQQCMLASDDLNKPEYAAVSMELMTSMLRVADVQMQLGEVLKEHGLG